MTENRLELVRAITDGFSALDFEAFRDALTEARDLEGYARLSGPFGELLLETLDPEVEITLHDIRAGSMVGGQTFRGWEGWLDFWRTWLEPWGGYKVEFSDWEEVGDTVVVRLDIDARGRGSGVEVNDRIAQTWTVREGRVTRVGMYPSRRHALAALGRE